jgi:2,3-bisphosphoglycerate-independent phosphoglycerate mutase
MSWRSVLGLPEEPDNGNFEDIEDIEDRTPVITFGVNSLIPQYPQNNSDSNTYAQKPHNPQKPEHPLKGLPLLPDDWRFVNRRTAGRKDKSELLREYRRRWIEASEAEPVPHKRDNAGRRAANLFLLDATDKMPGMER